MNFLPPRYNVHFKLNDKDDTVYSFKFPANSTLEDRVNACRGLIDNLNEAIAKVKEAEAAKAQEKEKGQEVPFTDVVDEAIKDVEEKEEDK